MLYLCRVKPLRHYLRGFLIAAWAGDKIAEFSFPEISFHFPLRPWFFCKPRVCGEKPFLPKQHVPEPGITPACAGKRQALAKALSRSRDHPRMCGEKESARPARPAAWGSPPHVRGKAEKNGTFCPGVRITPACAGKRMHQWCRTIANWDHPRMCGEKPLGLAPAGWPSGSPPHVRGKD